MLSRHMIFGAVAGSVAAVAVVGAVPAYALTTVTVSAGSAPSGTSVAFSGVSGTVTWSFGSGSGTCKSSSLTGNTKAGTNSPSSFAQINGGAGQIVFNSCTILGLPFTVNGVGTAKWPITATGSSSSGKTPVNITGINVAVDSTSCSFNVSGSVVAQFVNGNPSTLAIAGTTGPTSNLVVSNVVLKSGATRCLAGAATSGSKASVSATYTLTATTSAYNPVTAIAS